MKMQEFTIWTPTTFGLICFKVKAFDFTDAFLKVSQKNRMKDGFIEDEDGTSHTFNAILGIEETI